MSTNKSDATDIKEDKVTENQSKTQMKTNSSKVDSNNRRVDSTDPKHNERSFRSNQVHRGVDNRSRSGRNYSYYNSYNDSDRRYYNSSYFFPSNRVSTHTTSSRRPEHKSYHIRPSNGEQSSNDTKKSNEEQNRRPIDSRDQTKRRESHYGHHYGYPKRYPKRDISPEVHQNLQQKLDEITALKSIFDENILTVDETEMKGRFLAEPKLNENGITVCYEVIDKNKNERRFRDRYRDKCPPNDSNKYQNKHNSVENRESEEFCVKHLPPIELFFELSRKYPSKLNPMFLISCKWLSLKQLERICEKLEELYFECRMEVLFTWFSFLQNDVLNFLEIEDKLDITSIINWNSSPNSVKENSRKNWKKERVENFKPRLFRGDGPVDSRAAFDLIGTELIQHLKSYDEYKQKEMFKKSFFVCNICFSSHLGEDCVVFPCNHINCKTCIRGYFTTLIKEGTVHQLKCPDVECQTTAPNSMVRELISGELYERYDKLMIDSMVGSMTDAHYCPRKMCGNLVIAESDSSLAHCSYCGHAFCKNCKQTYHGIDPCNMFRDAKQRKEILEEYQNANATERTKMEKIYGKKQLVSALEEMASEKWMEERSQKCPHCKASIEKSDGCNKMACWRCNTYFCWLCLEKLPLTQPYSHFNNPESKCFNQLFRGVTFNAEDMFEDDFD